DKRGGAVWGLTPSNSAITPCHSEQSEESLNRSLDHPNYYARSTSLWEILRSAQDDAFCAGSFFAWRFSKVICLILAESDGLQVAMSGSSLKALCTMRRS